MTLETIKTAALFVLDPLWRGLKDLAELLVYLTPVLAFSWLVLWISSHVWQ